MTVRAVSVDESGYQSGFGPVSSVDAVRNESGPVFGPVSLRTDHPPFRGSGPSDRGRSKSDSLARWRRGQRHAESQANWSEIARVWLWLSTPDEQQRAICTATHDHRGRCPARHHR